MRSFVLAGLLSIFLAACGTSVPLTEAPVEDAKANVVGAGSGATGSGAQGGGVAPVDLGASSDQAQAALASSESRLVYFDYDSFVVKPEFQSLIAAHARLLRAQPARKVALEGHTDERGGREYNLALGQKRADAVRNALSILGVSQNQMEAVSFGKEKPVAVGYEEDAFAKNRRVEIRYP